jgi:glycosyltransferase involved in cell wall biosynthesis
MDPVKKRYLFLMKTNTWGGAERRMASYCANVDHSACSITWAVLKDNFTARFAEQKMSINVVEFPPENKNDSLVKRLRSFRRFINEQRPDVIIASNFWLTSFSLWEIMIASTVTGGNVFMVAHECPLPPNTPPSKMHWGIIPGLGLSWRLSSFKAKLISRVPCPTLAVCDSVKQHLVRHFGFDADKIYNLKFGADLNHFKPSPQKRIEVRRRYSIGERDTVIVSTSRMHKMKNLDRLVKAFASAAQGRDDVWLIMAGEGVQYGALSELARSFGEQVFKRIIFTGYVRDVAPYLQAADIFVIPSVTDGFCNSCVEAMSCGLVIIMTRCTGPESYVSDGTTGFLVENSTMGVIEGIQVALRLDDTEREMIGAAARSYVEKNFDRNAGIAQFLSIVGLPQLKNGEATVPSVAVEPVPVIAPTPLDSGMQAKSSG